MILTDPLDISPKRINCRPSSKPTVPVVAVAHKRRGAVVDRLTLNDLKILKEDFMMIAIVIK